jgi:DNA polymerase-3 subunit gamma/tau
MPKTEESNIALYTKYRPAHFDHVVGQDHIVNTIKSSLKEGKVSHAYLLSGPRGTGKTTIARIIARELGTSPSDIYEMDAASNRKIDDAREIRESVRSLPFDSKYKVYILDEVHMLTKEAWNALLKTIEEPPAYVVFILATTELEKVPDTIISRCQTFIFKKPTEKMIADLVVDVAKKEGYVVDSEGANIIALIANGAFRDSLGLLQKAIAFSSSKKISAAEILSITGAPESSLVDDFIRALAHNDLERGIMAVNGVTSQNSDMQLYIKLILVKLRAVLLLRYAPKMVDVIPLSEKDKTFLGELASKKPEHLSSRALSILLEAYQMSGHSSIKELPLELALVKILNIEK